MPDVTILSDAEFDAVGGGFLNFAIGTGFNANGQVATQQNIAGFSFLSNQGGAQTQNNVQNSGNFSGVILQAG